MQTSETRAIEIVVNGEARQVPQGLDIAGLLSHLEIDPSRVAVELNRAIVHKSSWPGTAIEDGAKLEIVWFVGGGK